MSPAVGPTRTACRRLNSRPSENISRITPSSDSVCDHLRVGDERDRHVRPDDQPGEHVAEHDRLAQALEQDRRHRRDARGRARGSEGSRGRRAW